MYLKLPKLLILKGFNIENGSCKFGTLRLLKENNKKNCHIQKNLFGKSSGFFGVNFCDFVKFISKRNILSQIPCFLKKKSPKEK
jgi:hypothetical protein